LIVYRQEYFDSIDVVVTLIVAEIAVDNELFFLIKNDNKRISVKRKSK